MPPPSRASLPDAPRRGKCTTKTPGPRAGWRATPVSSAPAVRFFVWWPASGRLIAEKQTGPLTPAAVQLFLTVPPGADRACGFDIPGPDPATRAAGRYFSPRSVGHLGFTGTSFWLDLETGQMVVLLTNRVHLGRDDKTKIAAFRPRFHEAASRALGF